ncbi:DUF3558 domain-containing protein [Amycolatopsis magusensis]|uniref:DUF3558 domain-containing protein n=1 Tax=Amycolatopsis magusensis TaxID=882444 RepID=A0ABS4PN72_9PSEU|nr:DUF3558 domain-containing protein [Amycolatopsis magusensis]MBP2180308.1 hypothetical protein [Amycolatopsis magusensis]
MRRPTRGILCAVGLVLLLSGCEGDNVHGSPTVPTAGAIEPAPPASDVPGFGAPKVDSALDTSKVEATPCESLTDAQITDLLGTDTSETEENVTGPACRWNNRGEQNAFVAVHFPKVTDLGLTAIYQAKGGQYKFFQEMPAVRGFPAVAWSGTDETMTMGKCNVAVGTSDRTTVEASVRLSDKNVGTKDPCEAARGVLDLVIGNIQGGR